MNSFISMKNESSIFTDLETDHGSSPKIFGQQSKSSLWHKIQLILWTGFQIGAK